jgi:hypothetical protein
MTIILVAAILVAVAVIEPVGQKWLEVHVQTKHFED